MRGPWENAPIGAAADRVAALNAQLPQITTDRLILRPCQITDWPVLEPIFTTERAKYIGGPMSAHDAWLDFNQLVAGWFLRGHGSLTITDKSDGTVFGLVLLGHEFIDPFPELGWLMTEAAEGHGYATEAASALRDWSVDLLGQDGFVSYIYDKNTPSIRVAEKLGATRASDFPDHPDLGVYRFGGAV